MISINLTKQHLRLTGTDEDVLVDSYIDAAVSAAENYTGRKLYASQADIDADENASESALVLTQPIQSACLLFIGHLYENRETTAQSAQVGNVRKLPYGFEFLLRPYKHFCF